MIAVEDRLAKFPQKNGETNNGEESDNLDGLIR